MEPLEARELLSASGTDFNGIVGATQTRATYGVDGSGMTVAVIDTGVNYNNQAFGGGGFGPGHKVVAGSDIADATNDPNASWQHGTAVAGIIASSDPAHPGVAPGADIAALRVFNSANKGDYTWVASALQWVIDNHAKSNITAVNLSLSDGGNYTSNWWGQDGGVGQQITNLVSQLKALNIPVISATGNSFTGAQGEGFTAIIPDTISVTATDASNHLLSDAQRLGSAVGGASATKIAAPGQGIVAPAQGNDFASGDGTSFATPIVSGAVVLLQQIYESRFGHLPSVDDVETWLQQGADPVTDPVTGITIGRLDLPRAAALIPAAPAAETLTPPPPSPPPPLVDTVTPPPAQPTAPSNPDTGAGQVTQTGGDTAQVTKTSQASLRSTRWTNLFSLFSNLFRSTGGAFSFAGARNWNAGSGTDLGRSHPAGSLRPLGHHALGGPSNPGR